MLEGVREVEEERERPCGLALDILLTYMIDYIMAVKSGLAGAFRKCFGSCGLEPLHGCCEDAILAGFSPSPAPAPGQGPLLAHVGTTQARPVIAAGTTPRPNAVDPYLS
jgi:hypothetical protein